MDGLRAGGVTKLICPNGCIGRNDGTGVVSGVGEVRERDGGTSNASEADWELRSWLGKDVLWGRLRDLAGSLVLRGDVFFSLL